MSQIQNILEGWGKLVADKFNQLDQESKDLAASRMQHCNTCELRLGSICDPTRVAANVRTGNLVKGCGCNLPAKTLATKSSCPMSKW